MVPSFLSAGQSQGRSGAWGTPLVPRNKAVTQKVQSVVKLFSQTSESGWGTAARCSALRRSLHPQGRFGVKLGNLQTVGE